jgi:hypothetical protein
MTKHPLAVAAISGCGIRQYQNIQLPTCRTSLHGAVTQAPRASNKPHVCLQSLAAAVVATRPYKGAAGMQCPAEHTRTATPLLSITVLDGSASLIGDCCKRGAPSTLGTGAASYKSLSPRPAAQALKTHPPLPPAETLTALVLITSYIRHTKHTHTHTHTHREELRNTDAMPQRPKSPIHNAALHVHAASRGITRPTNVVTSSDGSLSTKLCGCQSIEEDRACKHQCKDGLSLRVNLSLQEAAAVARRTHSAKPAHAKHQHQACRTQPQKIRLAHIQPCVSWPAWKHAAIDLRDCLASQHHTQAI